MRIVVMGGSFNPPTIAHLKMMRSALDQLGAEKASLSQRQISPCAVKCAGQASRRKYCRK